MQRSTMVLGGILALLMLLAALFVLGGTLSGQVTAVTANAANYPEAWASICDILADGTAPVTFSVPLPEDPAECCLEDVTLTLYNPGLIDAEWVSVSVENAPGDIAAYSISGEGDPVRARSAGAYNLKFISRVDGHTGRAYRVQYYVFGMKREIRIAG